MYGPLEYLPQGDEVWLFLVRKANGFLEDSKGRNVRPYMILLFEIAPKTELYRQEVLTDDIGVFPTKDFVWSVLEETMKTDRTAFNQPAHRPKSVIFTSEKLYKELAKPLWVNGIYIKLWTEQENQGFGDEYVKLYSTKLREKQALSYKTSSLKPSILSILKSKDKLKTFFEATAKLFKEAPWKIWNNPTELFIISWPEAGTRVFFYYPVKNEDIRIGIETSPQELEHLFKTGERATLEESNPNAYHRCLFYTDEFSLPFDDLYDIETQSLPIGANPEETPFCYPFPIAFRKDMANFFRPPINDLEWMEVASHALAEFTADYKQGKFEPKDGVVKKISYRVPIYNRHTELFVTWVSQTSFSVLNEVWNEVSVPEVQFQLKEPIKLVGTEHDPNACRVCKSTQEALKKCGRCKQKLYCSRECQSKDWPIHQKICVKKD